MKLTRRRFWVYFLLFVFSAIAYVDRVNMSVAGKPIALELGLSPVALGYLFSSFLWAYVLMMLPGGRLIVLMADHQTTGGYPRIAHVVSAHLPKLAQLRPSDAIQFKLMDLEAAEHMLVSRQKELHILQRSCKDHLNEMVC